MSLIENVKAGYRLIIPGTEMTSCEISGLIQECWQHDPDRRPSAFRAFEMLNCYYGRMQAGSEACSESDNKDIHFESTDSLVEDDICSDYNEVETIQSDVETINILSQVLRHLPLHMHLCYQMRFLNLSYLLRALAL